ncbi:MAG: hypothetical protein HXY38_13080 [Chloroflexi bacterium]|nr:hypothetical protein [Chloroflexota bacterium]
MKFSFPFKIYLIALALRLVPVLLTMSLGIGLDDMFQYDMLARSLASGNGYRWYAREDLKLLEPYVEFDLSAVPEYDPQLGVYTSFRAPLYPAFLAAIYFLSGLDFSRFFAARMAQVILLGAPLAPLTYLVAKRFFTLSTPSQNAMALLAHPAAEQTARLSAWVVACYPILLVYPLGLGTENLFFTLLLLSFLFLLKITETPSILNFLLFGFFLALTALTRSVILPFAGVSLLHFLYLYRKKALTAAAAFLFVVSPWALRNSLLHHKLTGIETSMGYNLCLGYHPDGNGSFIFGPSLDLLTIMDDAERDAVGTQKAIEFIRAQPERFIPLAFNRLGFFFGLEKRVLIYFYSNNILGYIPLPWLLLLLVFFLSPFVLTSLFAVLGFAALRRSLQTHMLSLLFFAYILPHILILSEDRFHLALIPFAAILAAFAFTLMTERSYLQFTPLTSLVAAALLMIFLALNWGLELHRDADKIAAILRPDGHQSYFPY